MKLEISHLETLAGLAATAARSAGAYIAESSQREIAVMHKVGGDTLASQVVTEESTGKQSR